MKKNQIKFIELKAKAIEIKKMHPTVDQTQIKIMLVNLDQKELSELRNQTKNYERVRNKVDKVKNF